ncbi:CPBP family intramembrane glutamic endopeptidase [Brachybacterium sp. sponge]|uniref:CPBP family intramembrane glutamic endopeptidase n=1 Tax=Brachybacterium sp. sponge TaxID=1775432 RepID=UPI0007A3D16B|nr:CPBP family intramembrane glutamic endopeptidase [Brachybacterium sp. sponge]
MDTADLTAPAPAASPDPARAANLPPAPVIRYSRVPWRRIGLFMLISYGLFALAAAPFWFLPGGIAHPAFTPVIAVGMWAPAAASLIMAKGVERVSWRTRVGLRFRGRWARILAWMPLGLVLVVAILLLSELVAAVRGVPMDLTGRTWLETGMAQVAAQTGQEIPAIALVLITAATVFAGLLVTTLATLGEEIGWRGWLWLALTPLGRIPATLVGGVIWSLWHLPVVLIGYNYPGADRAAAVAMFLLPCIAMTLLFGALTDRASGSPLPAALAHAGINTLSGVLLGIAATTQTMAHYSHFLDGPLGIAGVLLMAAAGGLLLLGKREPALPHLDPLGDGRGREASPADG